MTKRLKYLPFLLLSLCVVLNSCSEEDERYSINSEVNDNLFLKHNEVNYLTDYEANLIATELVNGLNLYSQNINGSSVDLSDEVYGFWSSNQTILGNVIDYTDEEEITLNSNGESFLPVTSITVQDINEASFLTEIQKDYSTNLLNAAENNDFTELVELKNSYFIDVVDHPELQVYSLAFALINETEQLLFQKSDPDCREQALQAALIDGVIGMVVGVVVGGLGGFAAGGLASFGILAVPGGMFGVVVGGVAGALLGFAEGYVRGYLACKFWSWSW